MATNEVKRMCPECEKEVTLKVDPETGDREGRCANCKLDVGAVVNRLRYGKAIKKVETEEEGSGNPPKGGKKGNSWF